MNADKLPDVPEDPVPAAETPRSTDSPQPEKVPQPSPEPEHPSRPDQRQPPVREPKPERESHDEQQEPGSEHRPESPAPANEPDAPAPTDSPSHPTRATPDTEDTAEPRSRQEHADLTATNDLPDQTDHDPIPPQDDGTDSERKRSPEDLDRASPAEIAEDSPTEQQPDRNPSRQVLLEATGSGTDPEGASGLEPADLAFRPLTDQEYTEHVSEVRDRLAKAHDEGLATDFQHTIDPDHLRWTRERRQIHAEITEAIYAQAADVPCENKAVIAGGLGGAGKTTILHAEAGVDLSQYLMINPDDIKEEIAKRDLVPLVDGLSPMEATDLVHEESSAIAKQLARRAYADGKNLIWDITMSSAESTARRVNDLRQSGYTAIEGIFVDIPVEVSIARTQARHREGHEDFRAGRGLGGRLIPPEVIRSQADSAWGSQNRKTFEAIKNEFDRWTRYDNSVDGRRAFAVDRSTTKNLSQHKED